MRHVVLLLALSASHVQGMRRTQPSELTLSESAARNGGESGVGKYTSVASNSTSVLGLYYTSMVGKADNSTPEYAKKGICCKWDDRFGNEIYRFVYYMTKDKYSKEKYQTPWSCPGGIRTKWSSTDNWYCNGMPAYNKVGYKEDSDWVLCCSVDKKKVDYHYAGGEPCKSYGGGYSINPLTNAQCTNKDCYQHNNVDANDITCPKTHPTKIVNEKADWACSKGRRGSVNRPALYPDFTDMQCAGYDKNCALIHCIKHSITKASKRDCSSMCDLEFAMGPIAYNLYNGATRTAVYSFWLVIFIAAGIFSPTSA